MAARLESLTGDAIRPYIDTLAKLRSEVFAAFPYLYDGSREYEADYLRTYTESRRAVVVVALDDGQAVGAATATPLSDHDEAFRRAAVDMQIPVDRLFYCAESVLRPEYRGQGLGHGFFEHRERFAREHGFTHACFCAVVRPDDHPARPDDYRPLDGFWRKRGYRRQDGVTTSFAWQDRGDTRETQKTMQFWLRDLRETPPADAAA